MYEITDVTFIAEDPVPPGLSHIGYDFYPRVILLAEEPYPATEQKSPFQQHSEYVQKWQRWRTGKGARPSENYEAPPAPEADRIFLNNTTKLSRFEAGKFSAATLHDFKRGMYIKIPANTMILHSYPGQRSPATIVLSSEPISDEIAPPPVEEVKEPVPPPPADEVSPDKYFSAYSGEGRIGSLRELRYHPSQASFNLPNLPENQLTGVVVTVAPESVRDHRHVTYQLLIGPGTKVQKLHDGKLVAGSLDEIKKDMFIKFTTYSAQQDPTWVVFSESEIPSTIHDPRLAN
jgi:hypothetical protein